MTHHRERTLVDLDAALAESGVDVALEAAAPSFAFALARQVLLARRDRGWTQAELANHVGMTQQQIADIERLTANPTLTTLDRLFSALGLPKGFREAS